mmetsp:Transcript_15294/g.12981  ORF Transcript_15294/g.12981 Transcript_15294/m.12981 type:complete len:122 (-) Transcript_15294:2123-2488(-)
MGNISSCQSSAPTQVDIRFSEDGTIKNYHHIEIKKITLETAIDLHSQVLAKDRFAYLRKIAREKNIANDVNAQQELVALIGQSKDVKDPNEPFAQKATAAITVLNYAGFSFAGQNFEGVSI